MKSRILALLCAVGVLFSLNSCKKEYLVDVNGSLSGNIRNVVSNEYIGGVLVTIIVNKTTLLKDSTDELGNYTVSGVPVGTYSILFSKEGFGTMRGSVEVSPSDQVANTTNGKKQSYSVGIVRNLKMYPLTAKAEGTVTLNSIPSTSTTVTAYISPGQYYDDNGYSYNVEFEPYAFSTTTDAEGAYVFANLPVNSYVTFVAGTASASASQSKTLSSSSSVVSTIISNIDMTEESLRLLNFTGQGNNVYVDSTASIVLTFSENVSESITNAKEGFVKLYNNDEVEVLAEVIYNLNKITVKPAGSAKFQRGNHYYIDFQVYATESKSTTDEGKVQFLVKSLSGTLSAPVLEYDVTNGLRIATLSTGTNFVNTITYELWEKALGYDDFTLKTTFSNVSTPHYSLIVAPTAGYSYFLVASVTGKDGIEVVSRSTELKIQ